MRRRCARPQVERRRLGDEPWGRRGGRQRDTGGGALSRHDRPGCADPTARGTPKLKDRKAFLMCQRGYKVVCTSLKRS